MANVVMIAPTREFVQQLPNAKIPDRTDFKLYFQKDRDRFAPGTKWWECVARRPKPSWNWSSPGASGIRCSRWTSKSEFTTKSTKDTKKERIRKS